MKRLGFLLMMLCASSAIAGTYNDTTANNSFETAVNLNPYFSNGYSPDVGDMSGANTSLSAPWVTISGLGNGGLDYYRFTTSVPGTVIVDIDYTSYAAPNNPNPFDSWLRLLDSSKVQMGSNDDLNTFVGAGGSYIDFTPGWSYDSFIQRVSVAPGTYYVEVGRSVFDATYPLLNGDRYTLQVQVPVPEPETYAMMAAGLAVMGFLGRRRKKALNG